MKVDLYEVFLSYIFYCLIFYFMTTLTPFFFARFVASLTTWERSSGSIEHKDSSRISKRIQMNYGGQSCLSIGSMSQKKNIAASYLNVWDESISAIRFRTTEKGYLPHLSYIFRKLESLEV